MWSLGQYGAGGITPQVRRDSYAANIEAQEALGTDMTSAKRELAFKDAIARAGLGMDVLWGETPFATRLVAPGLGTSSKVPYMEGYETHEIAQAASKWHQCAKYLVNELETGNPAPGWICTATTRVEPEGIWRQDPNGVITRTAGAANKLPPGTTTTTASAASSAMPWGALSIVAGGLLLAGMIAWSTR